MTFQSSLQSAQTRAAVVRGKGGPFRIETLTVDQPRDDEVLVRIVVSDEPDRTLMSAGLVLRSNPNR
jgi:hypothetical protein